MHTHTSIIVGYVGQHAVSITCPMVVDFLLVVVSILIVLYAQGGSVV